MENLPPPWVPAEFLALGPPGPKVGLQLVEAEKMGHLKNWVVATQIFFIFTPKFGEDEPNLTSIFFKGVETTN